MAQFVELETADKKSLILNVDDIVSIEEVETGVVVIVDSNIPNEKGLAASTQYDLPNYTPRQFRAALVARLVL